MDIAPFVPISCFVNDIDLAFGASSAAAPRRTHKDTGSAGTDGSVTTAPSLFESTHPRLTELPEPDFLGRRIWLVGIGGCGMSGLAMMLKQRGADVRGSDMAESATTQLLEEAGVPVLIGHDADKVPPACDLVVASAAVKHDHPELLAAQAAGVEVITYAEAVGLVQRGRTGVSIAGTHGKSSTTAMLAHVLIQNGADPSFIVGALCSQIGGGSRTGSALIPVGAMRGSPGVLVAEACEFNRSFHHHNPVIGLINNVEEDHLEIYGTLDNIILAFRDFAKRLPAAEAGGKLLIAAEGAHLREVASDLPCRVSTFGWGPSADFQVQYDTRTRATSVRVDGQAVCTWVNKVPGEHMALNAAAAAILAHWLGLDWVGIGAALSEFAGVDRRLQMLGTRTTRTGGTVTVFDDYGHHPTECDKTLQALRTHMDPKRLICVFQPHQHSRTRFLLEQFAHSFSKADVVIVPHIYFVRDTEEEKQ
ncbi:MAG: UDP-N-acetylmuramate--L-alanine ligase, partial [Phycisphaerae bacterium]|nr:UDP-N-acetylmuramate--L-alanine ligase [Phycisphaerae bacterium]